VNAAPCALRLREATAADLARWDELVRAFPNHRVMHTRAWVESLRASGLGRPLYLLYERGGDVVGCLPGLLVRAGRWHLFGSPLPGWQTASMGPAFDPARLSTKEIVSRLVPYLESRHRVVHLELLHSALDADAMRQSGFAGQQVLTYRAPMFPDDRARTFKALKDSARRNVRRGERLGLVVRFEEDEAFVDEHYDQLQAVYLRSGCAIPFSKRRALECFRTLQSSGNLIAVSVYLPGGRISIASGMFLIEGAELLLWTWAHRPYYRWYRPTELMTWTVMGRALAAGCATFDFMGRGEFKTKFGAELDESKWRWCRSRPRWLGALRQAAGTGFRWQESLRGRAARGAARLAGNAAVRHNGDGTPPAIACVMGDVDLVRTLGLAGIACSVVAPPGSASRFSRFTRKALDWVDPWEETDELVERLIAYGLSQPGPPVLFYQDDRALLIVSRYRERLGDAFRFVVPDAKLVEQLVDKAQFQQLARRLDLPVPPGRALLPARGAPPTELGIDYPLFLKPLTRRPARWEPVAGIGKGVRIDAPAALHALWPRLAAADIPVMAQALVSGPETKIESYHVYVDERGDRVAEFTGRKLRTLPASFGDSTALTITDAQDVAALGRDVVRKLRLRGVAKLDFKRDPDGRLFLLEVNPRFTLWHHLGAVAGVNIPAIVYADLVREPRPAVATARADVQWCKFWRDRAAARASGVSLLQWLGWLARCEAKSALAWDDPAPALAAGLWRWLHTPLLATNHQPNRSALAQKSPPLPRALS